VYFEILTILGLVHFIFLCVCMLSSTSYCHYDWSIDLCNE